jgi:hypothetical protein
MAFSTICWKLAITQGDKLLLAFCDGHGQASKRDNGQYPGLFPSPNYPAVLAG